MRTIRLLKRFSLLISITLAVNAGFCWADQTCAIKESYTVDMPPFRSQDGVGFCYAFAAVGLVQQLYCKHKTDGCKYGVMNAVGEQSTTPGAQTPNAGLGMGMAITAEDYDKRLSSFPDDRLSVLEAVALANHGALVDGGFEEEALRAIAAQGSLSLEKCTPFDKLMASETKFFAMGVIDSNWWKRLQALFQQYKVMESNQGLSKEARETAACGIAQNMKDNSGLSTDLEQILAALKDKDFKTFVRDATIPKECAKKRAKLPQFKVQEFKNYDPLVTGPKIEELLKKGIPVGVSVCVGADSMMDIDNGKACGPHALVVSGIRSKCCGNQCTTQYRLYDSASQFVDYSDDKNMFQTWVDSELILRRMYVLGTKFRAREGTPVLRWIEEAR